MEGLDFNKGLLKDMIDAGKLHDFLLVKAPAIEGVFYHDAEDKPIDCNIYHPKYGYDGYVADSYQFTITAYRPTVYEDPRTHQTVWCRNYLQVLCLQEDGTYTSKDGEQVLIVPHSSAQQRLASLNSPEDFEEIYNRELARKGLADKTHDRKPFKDTLCKHVQDLIDLHEQKTTYEERKLEWIALAKEFQQFLRSGAVKKKDYLNENKAPFGYFQREQPFTYFDKLKSIERKLISLTEERLSYQKASFEANVSLLLSPVYEAIPLISEEYQRVISQLKECESWSVVQTEIILSIAGYILQSDIRESTSQEDFWNAIWERFEDCQRAYQLTEYLKWLKDKKGAIEDSDRKGSNLYIADHTEVALSQSIIREEIIDELVCFLKPFFPDDKDGYLGSVIKGEEDGDTKLVFKENGNKLAVLFRDLFDNYGITVGRTKADVEEWLLRKFKYYVPNSKETKEFSIKYLNGIISSNRGCASPIAVVKNVNGKLTIEAAARKTKKTENFQWG